MKKNKVLVLMATYNGEKYIHKQIDSILKQIDCEVTINISDDNSSDNTIEIVKKLKLKNKHRINIKLNKNRVFFNRNYYDLICDAEYEKYDFIAFSDQDDIFLKNKFINSINKIKKDKYDAVSTSVKCFGGSSNILKQSNKITKFDFLFEGAGQGCTFLMKSEKMIILKEFLKKNRKMVNEFYYHDWLIYLFFRAMNFRWFFLESSSTMYRIHKTNNTGNKYSLIGIYQRVKKLYNGWYFNQVYIAIKIYNKIKKPKYQFNECKLNILRNLVFNGRRKYSDRCISFIFFLVFIIKSKF